MKSELNASSSFKSQGSIVEIVNEEDVTKHRKVIFFTFLFLFVMNFIRIFDNGILPALTTTLKEDYTLSNLQIGSLGSLVYIGEVTGSLIAMPVY